MNTKLWRVVERFCRGRVLDAAAFGAFAQLVEENQEGAVRAKVSRWSDEEDRCGEGCGEKRDPGRT